MKTKIAVLSVLVFAGVCLGQDGYFTEFPWPTDYVADLAFGGTTNPPSQLCYTNNINYFADPTYYNMGYVATGITDPISRRKVLMFPNFGDCSDNVCVPWWGLAGTSPFNATNSFILNTSNHCNDLVLPGVTFRAALAVQASWPSTNGALYGISWRTNATNNSLFYPITLRATGDIARIYLPYPQTALGADPLFYVWRTNVVIGSWVKRFGTNLTDFGTAVITDTNDNVIVAGCFQGTVNFGGSDLTSLGDYDIFLAKYDSSGNHVWSKRYGGTGRETPKSIALDPAQNIFIGGDLFGKGVAKFDSSGNFVWSNAPQSVVVSIAVDSTGAVYATGSFSTTPGTTKDFGDGHTLYSRMSSTDGYLAKYSSGGVCQWANGFTNNGDSEYGTTIAVNRSTDTVVVGGWAYSAIGFGTNYYANASWGAFGFLATFDSGGTNIWSRSVSLKSPGDDTTAWAKLLTMCVDANGDIEVAGQWNVKADFGGGAVYAISQLSEAYLAKYSGTNGSYLWSKTITGGTDCLPYSLATDSQTNVVMTGYYYPTFNFGGVTLNSASSASDIFVAKYSRSGALTWAKSCGGTESDGGYGVAVDSGLNPIVTGYFMGTANFGGPVMTSAGSYDIFLMKMLP